MSIFVIHGNKNGDVLQMAKELQSDEDVLKQITESKVPVMIIYYASWCPHCKSMMSTWDDVASSVSGKADVYKIESEHTKEANSFPTSKLYKKGKLVETIEGGGQTIDELKTKLFSLSGGKRRLHRRGTRRFRNRARKTHRTLRRYVSLV
jgi:thioredoxin 1